VAGSNQAIQAALDLVRQEQVSRFWPIPPVSCYQARLWIAQGNLAAASRWAHESGLKKADTPIPYLYEVDYLTLARLLIAQGNLEAAETLLLGLHHSAAAAGRGGSLIEILILQALTFAAQDRGKEALSALAQALSLAEGEGFVRFFLDEGAPLAALLRQAVAQGLHTSYALHLLNVFGEVVLAPQSLVQALSERELDVLRRVAGGFSNQAIAQELVIAVSTVKKHVNSIYGKL
jgi:LuxR family maltose regulon positive regulatory protein